MRAGASLGWRVAVIVAFGATAAVAVIVSRGGPVGNALSAAQGAATQQAAVPRCTASGLRISLGAGTRVTGSDGASLTAYPLEFTNVSGAACILIGFPAVTAYQGDHVQVGLAAARDVTAAARRILLAPGQTAHASVDAVAPQARCRPVRAAGLRVAPPGQATARFVRRPLTACSARDVHGQGFLRVAAVQSGAGSSAGASA